MQTGHILADLRYKKGLTQTDLAEIIGVTKGAVGMWETNKRYPTTEKLIQLAQYFNVTTDYILGLTTEPPVKKDNFPEKESSPLSSPTVSSPAPMQPLSENATMLLDNFEKLCKEDQIYILGKTIELVREQKKAEADAPALKKAN